MKAENINPTPSIWKRIKHNMPALKKNQTIALAINAFWFLIIAFLSYRMPLYVDDYYHINSFATGERIGSFGDIIASVGCYYDIWGGRVLSMFLIQTMLMWPRIIYAIVNGLVYVAMVNIICAYADRGESHRSRRDGGTSVLLISVIYLICWFFMPDQAEVVIWPTGSITYMWMNTLIILFGLLYYRDYLTCINNSVSADKAGISRSSRDGVPVAVSCVVTTLLGFGAGLSAEASACAMSFALLIYTIAMIRGRWHITIDKWLGIGGFILGFVILMAAPGNYVRTEYSSSQTESNRLLITLIHKICRESFYMLLFLLVPFVIWLVLHIISDSGQITFADLIMDFKRAGGVFFIVISLVGIYVMTFPAGFADRIYQFPLIMILIATGISFRRLETWFLGDKSVAISRAIHILVAVLMMYVIVELIAGSLYAVQADTYFDRHIVYYHLEDDSIDGLLPGNGTSR